MWWIWLVPSLVVAGAAVTLAVSVLDTLRRVRSLRRQLDELGTEAGRAREVVDGLSGTVGDGLAER